MTLESLAKIFGYSPTYLSRMFQKYAGVTFKSYLQDIRLRYAWKDVRDSDRTLSEIALEHGFPNSKALARAFQEKIWDPSKRVSESEIGSSIDTGYMKCQ